MPPGKHQIRFHALDRCCEGRVIQGIPVHDYPEFITDPLPVMFIRLVPAPAQTKVSDHLLEPARRKTITQMIKQPDRGNVFRLCPGPVHGDPFVGALMVGPWEICLLLIYKHISQIV